MTSKHALTYAHKGKNIQITPICNSSRYFATTHFASTQDIRYISKLSKGNLFHWMFIDGNS